MGDASKTLQSVGEPELPARAAFFETIDEDERSFLDDASIGELLRGARLTRGDFDIERVAEELNIKKRVIDGIEMIDPSRLPKDVFLKNAIRAYVQYLKPQFPYPTEYAIEKFFAELTAARARIAAEEAAARAEAEAQRAAADAEAGAEPRIGAADGGKPGTRDWKPFVLSEGETAGGAAPARPVAPVKKRHVIDDFAPPPAPPGPAYQPPREPMWSQIAPAATLVAAIGVFGGLAWGAWTLLEDAQRIGLADSGAAPTELRVVERRDGALRSADVVRPAADAYGEGGVLSRVYQPPETKGIDGPIAEISSADAGVFRGYADDAEPVDPAERRAGLDAATAAAALQRVGALQPGAEPTQDAAVVLPPAGAATPILAPTPQDAGSAAEAKIWRGPKLGIHANGVIWVRVVDVLGDTVFQGNIEDGEMVALPHDRGTLVLRTGNAGGTVLVVDGHAFGPVGERGRVLTVEIAPSQIAATYPPLPELTARIRESEAAEPVRTAEPGIGATENAQQ